ncbi:MAG TPA: hypothetical protein PKN87_04845 [Syntrophomonadaceae bacterium]|nr:hypothetical protein [Syntrophomonadaceae bacterium]HPR92821.1 hypothetical protein [Syntrophomonadaceae bacterium]
MKSKDSICFLAKYTVGQKTSILMLHNRGISLSGGGNLPTTEGTADTIPALYNITSEAEQQVSMEREQRP